MGSRAAKAVPRRLGRAKGMGMIAGLSLLAAACNPLERVEKANTPSYSPGQSYGQVECNNDRTRCTKFLNKERARGIRLFNLTPEPYKSTLVATDDPVVVYETTDDRPYYQFTCRGKGFPRVHNLCNRAISDAKAAGERVALAKRSWYPEPERRGITETWIGGEKQPGSTYVLQDPYRRTLHRDDVDSLNRQIKRIRSTK